jgi:homopolymeric O-antigen transport system ATP-binding protein
MVVSIAVSNLSIDFPLYHTESRSLKKAVLSAATSRLSQDRKERLVVQAVRNVSITLKAGDRLGVVGKNGAGKTTLLRALAGIYEPAVGTLSVRGRLTALLDLNQGLNPDLTGRENIRLFALYKKLSRPETTRLEEDVIEFSDLEQFINIPVRTYSSGMMVRLGFALATAVRPQILIMDEWLLAGDAWFLEKAHDRLESVVRGADIFILSSHSAAVIGEWSHRVIWMDRGRIVADGPPEDVLRSYLPGSLREQSGAARNEPTVSSDNPVRSDAAEHSARASTMTGSNASLALAAEPMADRRDGTE